MALEQQVLALHPDLKTAAGKRVGDTDRMDTVGLVWAFETSEPIPSDTRPPPNPSRTVHQVGTDHANR